MSAFLNGISTLIRRGPAAVISTVVILTAVFGWLAGQATQPADGNLDSFVTDSPAALTQERIAELFPADQAGVVAQLVVTEADGDVLDASGVTLATELRAALMADPAVAGVLAADETSTGVATYADLVLQSAAGAGVDAADLDDAGVDRLMAAGLSQAGDQAAGIVTLLGTPDDTTTSAEAGMVLVFLDGSADDAALAAARDGVNALSGSFEGHEVYTFDFAALNEQVNEDLTSEMGRLLGVAFLLIIGILVAIYRKPGDVIASLLGLAFAIVWSQGLTVLLGPDYLGIVAAGNQMAMAIPILLVGLGVDYGIHLTMRTREEVAAGAAPGEAAGRAVTSVGTALVLATITTVVGFMTNITNPLPPLQDFGIIAAAGVVAAFVVMVTFVPSVRLLLARRAARGGLARGPAADATPVGTAGPVPQEATGALARLAAGMAPVATRSPVTVVALAGLLTIGAGSAATGLSTEFSQTDFFPSGSRSLETIEVVNAQFGGGLDETTSVLLEPAPDESTLQAYVAGLATVPEVRAFDGQVQVTPVTAADGSAVLLQVPTGAGESATQLVADLDVLAADVLPDDVQVSVTSEAILTGEILDLLQSSQITGLGITLLASMAILALAFGIRVGAPMLGVIAIVAVGVVTVWVLGIMALVDIPFNVMTAMVSSLAIGIGVPFGIHVVNRFLEDRETHDELLDAMHATLANTGGALIGSALTTVAGFGVLVLASIPPMRQFGIVTALTITLALLSSLTVLPALLSLWARSQEVEDDDVPSPTGTGRSKEPVAV